MHTLKTFNTTDTRAIDLDSEKLNRRSSNIQIRLFGITIGYIETATHGSSPAFLSYNHFATPTDFRGQNIGKVAAIAFTHYIKIHLPEVQTLKFSLSRQADTDDDPMKLRDGRMKLFKSLGATCTFRQIKAIADKEPRWCVLVDWPASQWPDISTIRRQEIEFGKRYFRYLLWRNRIRVMANWFRKK
ncbi:hypothetical protein AL051_11275 [Pseudomonas amygdali pv. dendropanacis]|nr:hypothetical protein AL051_11275 [Pseudomonas amygdali pv. dendropanacis]